MTGHADSHLYHAGSPSTSKSSKLVPLVLTLVVVAVSAWVVYQVYTTIVQIQKNAAEKMGKNHVVWSKSGVQVGVNYIEEEKYVDRTQSFLVRTWNLGSASVNSKMRGKQ